MTPFVYKKILLTLFFLLFSTAIRANDLSNMQNADRIDADRSNVNFIEQVHLGDPKRNVIYPDEVKHVFTEGTFVGVSQNNRCIMFLRGDRYYYHVLLELECNTEQQINLYSHDKDTTFQFEYVYFVNAFSLLNFTEKGSVNADFNYSAAAEERIEYLPAHFHHYEDGICYFSSYIQKDNIEMRCAQEIGKTLDQEVPRPHYFIAYYPVNDGKIPALDHHFLIDYPTDKFQYEWADLNSLILKKGVGFFGNFNYGNCNIKTTDADGKETLDYFKCNENIQHRLARYANKLVYE